MQLNYHRVLDPNRLYYNIDVSHLMPIEPGEVIMCVEDRVGAFHAYRLDEDGPPFAIHPDRVGTGPVSFRLVLTVRSAKYSITAATTVLFRTPGKTPEQINEEFFLAVNRRTGLPVPHKYLPHKYPQTLFENLLAGFPFRGYPIELGGLR
jgi:hypothetical protein